VRLWTKDFGRHGHHEGTPTPLIEYISNHSLLRYLTIEWVLKLTEKHCEIVLALRHHLSCGRLQQEVGSTLQGHRQDCVSNPTPGPCRWVVCIAKGYLISVISVGNTNGFRLIKSFNPMNCVMTDFDHHLQALSLHTVAAIAKTISLL
jgi:hypothetical protein